MHPAVKRTLQNHFDNQKAVQSGVLTQCYLMLTVQQLPVILLFDTCAHSIDD